MSKKISSGILLLIFSVVTMDVYASWKDVQTSLKDKVATAKQKISKIELKDVLNYTAKAAVITAAGIVLIAQYQMNKGLNSKIDELNKELNKETGSPGLESLIGVAQDIQTEVGNLVEIRKAEGGASTNQAYEEQVKKLQTQIVKLNSKLNKLAQPKEKEQSTAKQGEESTTTKRKLFFGSKK